MATRVLIYIICAAESTVRFGSWTDQKNNFLSSKADTSTAAVMLYSAQHIG